MSRASTSSSRARDRFDQTEPAYRNCPLCDSPDIKLGSERLTVSGHDGKHIRVQVRRWACPDCGERFLTQDSRRRLDLALGLRSPA